MDEKERIVEDILKWKTESERTGGVSFDYAELKSQLQAMTVSELETYWNGTVGEWVASRDDVYRSFEQQQESGEFEGDFEEFVQEQFEKVKVGDETAYGYLAGV